MACFLFTQGVVPYAINKSKAHSMAVTGLSIHVKMLQCFKINHTMYRHLSFTFNPSNKASCYQLIVKKLTVKKFTLQETRQRTPVRERSDLLALQTRSFTADTEKVSLKY